MSCCLNRHAADYGLLTGTLRGRMSTAPARRAPRIVFNSDGDIHFRGLRSAGDMAGFYRGIDELAGTQVDCYCYCISAGGDTYRHPSEVAPLLGQPVDVGTGDALEVHQRISTRP